MSNRALYLPALVCAAAVLPMNAAWATGPAGVPAPPPPHTSVPPTPAPSTSTSTPPGPGAKHYLTAADTPRFEWKFNGNFKDSGQFHPRGDLSPFDGNTPVDAFGVGHDGAANGATTDVGRFHEPRSEFRSEGFTFTMNVFADGCTGTIFSDGLADPGPSNIAHPYHFAENSIGISDCAVHTTGGVTSIIGVKLRASFLNRKPDNTTAPVEVIGLMNNKAWNDVHIVYDGSYHLLTIFVNGTKTEAPTVGLITVAGEMSSHKYQNDVLIGGPKEIQSNFYTHGRVDNFRYYASSLYPMSTMQLQHSPASNTPLIQQRN